MRYEIDSCVSLNETLNNLKPGDILYLKNGIYDKKIEIETSNITIIGESKENTIITNMDYFHKTMEDFNECNTFRTYTLYIGGDNVTISNITIENRSIPSHIYGQAVSLYVDGDNFKCENSIIRSAQDTLFTGPLPPDLIIRHQGFLKPSHLKGNKSRQIYINNDIYGDVDFIFGGAYALFYKCNLYTLDTNNKIEQGYICAPSHQESDKYGYLFYKCNLKSINNFKTFLARPWRDYGNASFIECNMDNHVLPEGYDKWGNSNRDKTARFSEYTENVDLSKRVKWAHMLTFEEKEKLKDEFFKLVNFQEN